MLLMSKCVLPHCAWGKNRNGVCNLFPGDWCPRQEERDAVLRRIERNKEAAHKKWLEDRELERQERAEQIRAAEPVPLLRSKNILKGENGHA
jgi:hypothetical protein